MGEDSGKEALTPSNIEEILRERERLDRILREKFKKELAILFTDICGYTAYTEKRGDVSSRAMLQKHNDIVLPLVERHEGVVIKTIGDAVMASFESALDAVEAAVAIQQRLDEENRKVEAAGEIKVKIGINYGKALVDGTDLYGDVVNVASRIQSQAGPEQILISTTVYNQIRESEDILCRYHGAVQVKGKTESLEIYRVIWGDEEIVADTEPKTRALPAVIQETPEQFATALHLEVAREGPHLKISAHEQFTGEECTIRHYEHVPISLDWIETRCREMVETLNSANRKGRLTGEVLTKLREVGQIFYDEFISISIKQKLQETGAEYLTLYLDDHLVHIPWELFHDGRQFLCQRFNMGRLVKTQQTVLSRKSRALARPLKMLIAADPEGDLKGAYMEGTQIRDHMDRKRDLINASLRSGNITAEFVKEKVRNFDLVHFAGHADYDPQNPQQSGWRLTGDRLSPEDIMKMAGSGTMPALVFSNACQSARTEKWTLGQQFQNEIFGLANAFLLAGVKHYLGTFWEIQDEPSSRFALKFYEGLMAGESIGEAVCEARLALIKEFGEENIVWASYLLYGDPNSNYLEGAKVTKPLKEPEIHRTPMMEAEVRAQEEVIDFGVPEVPKKKRFWWAVAAGIMVAAVALFWGYALHSKKQVAGYHRAALVHYREGDFAKALEICDILEEKRARASFPDLIRGNIYLRKGRLDIAESAYQKAFQAGEGTDPQRAETLIGLGRIASLRKQPDLALKYYRQATEVSPKSRAGYLSQALVLEEGGMYDDALSLLVKARKLAPDDQVLAALTKETRQKATLIRDQERQERIDRLVEELLESAKSPPRALPWDGWTSHPLTMWVMDFEVQGYSLQEGDERLLASGIADQVLQKSRIQLVERALLDKLLTELKLGSSKLIDRSTALSVGRILAARLILFGQVVYSETQTQVSLRLIETETGRISAAVTEPLPVSIPASAVTEELTGSLLKKLEKLYPIRGKILMVNGQEVRLNIGQKVGVKVGGRFRAIEKEVTLEIASVEPETSLARVTEGEKNVEKGLRVEALTEINLN